MQARNEVLGTGIVRPSIQTLIALLYNPRPQNLGVHTVAARDMAGVSDL